MKLILAKEFGIALEADAEPEKYPYFHVTNFTEVPNKPNIYLGIKGEKYSKDSYEWDSKKYFWSAQLKPNIKLYKPEEKWNLSEFSATASAIGFNEDFLKSSTDSDISFYRELIQENGKFEDLDDLVDQRPQYGFHILKAFSEKDLFSYLQHKGYQGIYDKQGKYLYEAADLTDEPQIMIFNPADIIWGKRSDNEDFHKLSALATSEISWKEVWENSKKHHTGEISTPAIPEMKRRMQGLVFTKENIPVAEIYSGSWTPEQPMQEKEDEKWAQNKYSKLKTQAPPIAVERTDKGYNLIDGTHRSRAAYLRQEKNILAYVGIKKIPGKEAEAEQFDDAQIPLRTTYPHLEEPAPKTDGTYPTRYNVDKMLFQASSDLPFKPTAKEVLEVANYVHSPILKEQLTAMVFEDSDWLGEVCLAVAAQDEFPKAGTTVDGRKVGSTISNLGSISSTLTAWEELPGIREISMSDWEADPHKLFYSKNDIDRCKKLAAEIEHSKRIDPLIVVIPSDKDKDGVYVLEGGHRLGALHILKAKSFPALVVIDTEDRAVEAKASFKGLEAEAAKCETFEEFKKAFSVDIKHGLYWHVTADPDFKIDPSKGPSDMSSMSNGKPKLGKLMVTSHLEHWTDYYGKDRPYAAEIDMSEVDPKDYQQVARGFGNEFWVENPAKAKVVKVYKVQQALRRNAQYRSKLPNSDKDLRQIFDKVHVEVVGKGVVADASYGLPYEDQMLAFFPEEIEPADFVDALGSLEIDEDYSNPKLLESVKNAKIVIVKMEDLDKYKFWSHGLSFKKDPPGHTNTNPSESGPAIVFKAQNNYYVLDGQHRIAQAVEDGHSFKMFVVPTEWLSEELKSTRKRWQLPTESQVVTADFPAIKPGMLLYHGTSQEGAESIRKTGIDMRKSHKGYFGQGFYTAVDEDLAKSNYADFSGDEEGGAVLTFKLKPGFRVLDMRNDADYAFWTSSGLDKKISLDGFAEMAVKKGVDGLFDRSFEGVVIYNPKAVELVK